MGKTKDQPKQETEKPKKTKGSLINKVLSLAVVVLLAFNINLYLKKQASQSKINVEIQKSKDGSQLSFNYNTQFIQNDGIQKVMNSLLTEFSTKVTSLDLQLSMCQLSNIELLTDPLSKFSHITKLTLNIGTNPLGNSSAVLLAQTLKRLTKLQYLDLGIDTIFNKEGRDQIFEAIGQLPLEFLRISMIHSNLANNGLTSLNKLLTLQKLKGLHLVLVGCKLQPEDGQLLGDVVGKFNQLDDLHINLYANKILADGASSLASGLYHQKSLTSFELELYFNNITTTGTESVTGAMTRMKNLTNLRLGLEFNYIENEGGILVGQLIQNLTELKNLTLNLATKNFGYYGYEAVVKAINTLNHLEYLDLNIGINRCGVPGAINLRDLLKRHNKLRVLRFNFLENYVGDNGAISIAEGIRAQQNLEELSVVMSFNTLSGVGALEITNAVVQAKSPRVIDLRLSQNEINDEDARQIFQIVNKKLPEVDRFEFEFLNTALSNSTRDALVEQYGNNSKLELRINTIPPSNWKKE